MTEASPIYLRRISLITYSGLLLLMKSSLSKVQSALGVKTFSIVAHRYAPACASELVETAGLAFHRLHNLSVRKLHEEVKLSWAPQWHCKSGGRGREVNAELSAGKQIQTSSPLRSDFPSFTCSSPSGILSPHLRWIMGLCSAISIPSISFPSVASPLSSPGRTGLPGEPGGYHY